MCEKHVSPDPAAVARGPKTVATAVVDTGGLLVAWSPRAEHLLGYAAHEVLRTPAACLLASPAPDSTVLKQLAAGCQARRVVLRHRDGGLLPMVVSATPLIPESGMQWLLWAEPDGEPGEDYRHALIDSLLQDAPIAVGVYDSEQCCVVQNAELRRMSGLADDQRLGRTTNESLPGLDRRAVEQRQRQVLEFGRPRTDEVRGTTPSDPVRVSVAERGGRDVRGGEGGPGCHRPGSGT